MKFLLLSRHTGGRAVPEMEKEQNLKDLFEWFGLLKASTAMPVNGGKSITSKSIEEYQGVVKGMLVFEAESIDQAVELAKKSPGLKYGWTHDVLLEMPVNS
jgi:hypothetical protein